MATTALKARGREGTGSPASVVENAGGESLAVARHKVAVYPITGRQFSFVSIPHRLCEECDLTIGLVRRVAAEMEGSIEVEVKPWLRYAADALRRGGWHAPVVTLDGKVFSQGVVPDEAALRAALRKGASSSENVG